MTKPFKELKDQMSPEAQREVEAKVSELKGEKNGLCNRSACLSDGDVVWFNHSTEKYYCTGCALWLNSDPFNRRDAMEMWGHDLCTREEPTSKD